MTIIIIPLFLAVYDWQLYWKILRNSYFRNGHYIYFYKNNKLTIPI